MSDNQKKSNLKRKFYSDSNPLLTGSQILLSQFEYQYKSDGIFSDESKIIYLKTLNSLYDDFIVDSYVSYEENSGSIELTNLTESRMQKRIDLISELIRDNSNIDTKTSAVIKTEGVKIYSNLIELLYLQQF